MAANAKPNLFRRLQKVSSSAAILVIGDEILSGRTQDTNTSYIARFLGALGIELKEARVVKTKS